MRNWCRFKYEWAGDLSVKVMQIYLPIVVLLVHETFKGTEATVHNQFQIAELSLIKNNGGQGFCLSLQFIMSWSISGKQVLEDPAMRFVSHKCCCFNVLTAVSELSATCQEGEAGDEEEQLNFAIKDPANKIEDIAGEGAERRN